MPGIMPSLQKSTRSSCVRFALVHSAVRRNLSMKYLIDSPSFCLLLARKKGGNFHIAVREAMKELTFYVAPRLDTAGLKTLKPFKGDPLKGADEQPSHHSLIV